ncbi:hypothetical protein [Paenibacillus planticolens]|uniref:hypothetical protein n=1 Tax=Paenibacillus planticolens TaxID=2654976 RepID=UPI001C105F0C|nr:hypothetical protein [Paenibacillus planticolens]
MFAVLPPLSAVHLEDECNHAFGYTPGEQLEVDWAGQTAFIIDRETGEIITMYFLLECLPTANMHTWKPSLHKIRESWITAHINMYHFFGGFTRVLTPDNLKTGVEKASGHSPVFNKI